MEDWQGAPDPKCRGTGGLVFVQSTPDPNPIAPAMVEGARSIGMPTFDSNNGRLMEGDGGASIIDLLVRDGKRLSVFRTYVFPYCCIARALSESISCNQHYAESSFTLHHAIVSIRGLFERHCLDFRADIR